MIATPFRWRVQKVSSLGLTYRVGLYEPDNGPVWSPDEQSIAWTPGRDLFLVDVAQRTRRRLAGPSCAARWSTDGRSLLYLGGSCIEAPHHPYVAVVSLATGSRRVIARGSFNSADWSPDGRRIAYAGACDSGPGDDPWCEVFLSNADGSGFRKLRLPPKAGVVDWVRWTDASTVVSGGTGPDERVGLTRFEVDKNTAAALAPGQIYIWPTAPAVTADGIIGVIQRFGPRTGRPALVNTRTGEVQWGQVPKGWAGDAAAIHDT